MQRRQTLLSHRGRDRLPEFGRTPRSSALEMRYGNPSETERQQQHHCYELTLPFPMKHQSWLHDDMIDFEAISLNCFEFKLSSLLLTVRPYVCIQKFWQLLALYHWQKLYLFPIGVGTLVSFTSTCSITNNIRLAWSRLQTLRPDEMADNLSKFEHQRNGNIYILTSDVFYFIDTRHADKRFVLVDFNLGSARTGWRIAPVHMAVPLNVWIVAKTHFNDLLRENSLF